MEQFTVADVWSEWRRVGLRHVVAGFLAIAVYVVALRFVNNPTISDTAQTFWTLIPFPFLLLGYWSWSRYVNRAGEVAVAVENRAATTAWRFTILWLLGLALLDAAVGFPILTPMGGEIGWKEVIFMPLFVYAVSSMRAIRQLLPRA